VAVPIADIESKIYHGVTEKGLVGVSQQNLESAIFTWIFSVSPWWVFLLGVKGPAVALSTPTFVPVDAQPDFVLICDYTGKEVVE
jgi:hypothetical protein